MKTFNAVLAVGIVTAALTGSATAADAFLSPRAQANQITRVLGVNADRNYTSGQYLGALNKALNNSHSMVASGAVADVNLVSGNYAGTAQKDPARELNGSKFQIAPVVEKSNARK